MRAQKFLIIFAIAVYLWFLDFEFFEPRGFGYDHLYYRNLLDADNLNSFILSYRLEGATEPLSGMFFYLISMLPLETEHKFFLVRLFIFLLFIWGLRFSQKLFIFGVLIYMTPLMQTLFQSNLRQGLSIALLTSLLPFWFSVVPFVLGLLMHWSASIFLLGKIILSRDFRFAGVLAGCVLSIIFLIDLPAYFSDTLMLKVMARTTFTEIQNLGYFFHMAAILSIYLISKSKKITRLNKQAVIICVAFFLLAFLLLPLNHVPQRLIPFVWLLPIYVIYSSENPRNMILIYFILISYSISMWYRSIWGGV